MINSDMNNGGIYRAFILSDSSDIRIYIPGLYNNFENCPIDSDNNLNMEIFQKNKETYSKPLWCIPNLEAKRCDPVHPCWVTFENGNINRPIIMGFLGKGIKYSVGSSGVASSAGGSTELNAKKIFWFYDALGVPKINISGILGNYYVENYIDPTTVETIYDEPFNIGPKKQAAQSDWNSFTVNTVFTYYANNNVSLDKNGYMATDGKYYPGIAANSATGDLARRLIDYANKIDMNWFNLELQLMFNLQYEGSKNISQYRFMTENWNVAESSPSAAAITFAQNYEHSGISPTASGILNSKKREDSAADWYSKMGNWESELAYGYAIMKKGGYEPPSNASNFDKEIWDSASDKDMLRYEIVNGLTISNSGWAWPVPDDPNLGSPYGMRIHPITGKRKMHTGVDIGAPAGIDIIASKAGVVIHSSNANDGYGNKVIIEHDNNFKTLYAHASELCVNVGDEVIQGAVIAKVGSTGMSTGPHLHFEIHINNAHTNPMNYIVQPQQ